MKHLPNIIGGLLGLAFAAFGTMYFLNMMPKSDPPPEGSPIALFMGAMAPSGYLSFVKALELIGGLLVAIPKTRNFGLLIIGPILVNIIAFHVFLGKGANLFDPALIVLSLMAVFLLWSGRRAFACLA
jgi:putative oxidoreductase